MAGRARRRGLRAARDDRRVGLGRAAVGGAQRDLLAGAAPAPGAQVDAVGAARRSSGCRARRRGTGGRARPDAVTTVSSCGTGAVTSSQSVATWWRTITSAGTSTRHSSWPVVACSSSAPSSSRSVAPGLPGVALAHRTAPSAPVSDHVPVVLDGQARRAGRVARSTRRCRRTPSTSPSGPSRSCRCPSGELSSPPAASGVAADQRRRADHRLGAPHGAPRRRRTGRGHRRPAGRATSRGSRRSGCATRGRRRRR